MREIEAGSVRVKLKFWASTSAGILLGAVFLISSLGKLLGGNAFLLSISVLSIYPESLRIFIADWLPWGELLLGITLVLGIAPQLVSLIATVLIGCFIFQNTWMIFNGYAYEPCHCFGLLERIFENHMSTKNALVVDIIMIVFSVSIYFLNSGKIFEWRPWFMRLPCRADGE
jgi:uncharacterized membrane protein YphA (DoxX/SURF4 family)